MKVFYNGEKLNLSIYDHSLKGNFEVTIISKSERLDYVKEINIVSIKIFYDWNNNLHSIYFYDRDSILEDDYSASDVSTVEIRDILGN